MASAPENPPLAKVGVPGFDTTAWQMIVAPGGTPKPILEKLNTDVNAIMQADDIKKHFVDLGLEPLGKDNLQQLDAFVKSETARWAPVIKNAGLAGSQ